MELIEPTYTDSGTITQHFHGTHVAGTVAAVNNNGIRVCGVAGGTGVGDGVRLMSCQNYDTDANGQEVGSVTEESFIYAADNGAVIAQCSWGYNGIETPLSMQRAIQYFIREAGTDENGVQTGPMKGGVVCFSAGNSSYSHVGNPGDMEEVVGVTAMGPDYKKAGYSNYARRPTFSLPEGRVRPIRRTRNRFTAPISTAAMPICGERRWHVPMFRVWRR